MKDFTCVCLPSQPVNLWPCEIFKVFYQYFENAHGQLTSFIRLIADEEVKRFHYGFVAAIAAHGG